VIKEKRVKRAIKVTKVKKERSATLGQLAFKV
jgi:hypothetical protein